MALAGVTACTRQPVEKIVPYVRQPEELIPGRPMFFATAMPLGGVATGLLVESHEGRPTKIEGNPLHPGSLGAADVFAQASILGLYDPDRSKTLTNLGEIRPWSAFLGAIRAALVSQQPFKGAGIRILTESVSSPTLAAQIRDVMRAIPSAKWHQWDPASGNNARRARSSRSVSSSTRSTTSTKADVIVSLDSDFLRQAREGSRYARDFSSRRRPEDAERMNRFYAVETMPTSTGAKADHRLPLKPSDIESFARELAGTLGVPGGPASADAHGGEIPRRGREGSPAHRGRSLVVAGEHQPAGVHALAHAMNSRSATSADGVPHADCRSGAGRSDASLRDLAADMTAGKVDLLFVLSRQSRLHGAAGSSVRRCPRQGALRVRLGLHDDETSALCHWQIPEAHFLESWSDARAYDGTASIVQPLIAPLYGGRSAHEVRRRHERPSRAIRATKSSASTGKVDPNDTSAELAPWLHDGVIPDTAFSSRRVAREPPCAIPLAPVRDA